MGIDFTDTIVARTNINKGTSTISGPVMPSEFMGDQNAKKIEERLKLAGDMWIMSAKGTSKIKLSEMLPPKKTDIKGFYVSTERGTARTQI